MARVQGKRERVDLCLVDYVVAELAVRGLLAGCIDALGDQRDLAVVEGQAVAVALAVGDLGYRHIGEGEVVDLGRRRAARDALDAHAFHELAGGEESHHVGQPRLVRQGHVHGRRNPLRRCLRQGPLHAQDRDRRP